MVKTRSAAVGAKAFAPAARVIAHGWGSGRDRNRVLRALYTPRSPPLSWTQFSEVFLEKFVPHRLRKRNKDQFEGLHSMVCYSPSMRSSKDVEMIHCQDYEGDGKGTRRFGGFSALQASYSDHFGHINQGSRQVYWGSYSRFFDYGGHSSSSGPSHQSMIKRMVL
ncbi:hypothetical protein HAX54_016628 [Datura stramonium]|uniref:Uncharacterized protein n=1 Tax=Datura stramonium TaxID=4076 RepID=A0ABS8UJ65_DATST|nr:hypothetical protein [Datura stramonium]